MGIETLREIVQKMAVRDGEEDALGFWQQTDRRLWRRVRADGDAQVVRDGNVSWTGAVWTNYTRVRTGLGWLFGALDGRVTGPEGGIYVPKEQEVATLLWGESGGIDLMDEADARVAGPNVLEMIGRSLVLIHRAVPRKLR